MRAATMAEHFEHLAPVYARLRATADYVGPLADAMAAAGDLRGRRVLDCGCGAGALLAELRARYGVRGWGLDASPRMAAAARAVLPAALPVLAGRVEALPLRAAVCERVTMSLVVHHLDRPRAFGEIRRVLVAGGRLVIATTDPAGVEGFWASAYFPTYAAIERRRFPSGEQLRAELTRVGFTGVTARAHALPRAYSRTVALEKLRGRAYSTLALLDEEEYRRGLAAAEADLPDPVAYALALLLVTAECPR